MSCCQKKLWRKRFIICYHNANFLNHIPLEKPSQRRESSECKNFIQTWVKLKEASTGKCVLKLLISWYAPNSPFIRQQKRQKKLGKVTIFLNPNRGHATIFNKMDGHARLDLRELLHTMMRRWKEDPPGNWRFITIRKKVGNTVGYFYLS